MEIMKAVVKVKAERGIEVLDKPKPKIKSDEVLLHVAAVSICGSDLNYYVWGGHAQLLGMTLPRILGHEGCGLVSEVGEAVTRFKVGDRVVTDSWGGCGLCYYCRMGKFNLCEFARRIGTHRDGCMAEYVAVPEHTVYHLPENISFDEAALLEPFGVGVHAIEISHLKLGDNVVVMGPGPIGLLQGIGARAAGAAKVIITGLSIDEGRLRAAAKLGFTTINVEKENAEKKVKELTDGRGADVVFECATGRWDQAIPLVQKGGEIVAVGLGEQPLSSFDVNKLILKEVTITPQLAREPSAWYRAINLVATKTVDIKQIISHFLPLEEAPEAFRLLLEKEATKVVLKP
jgi:L-iditol 2-dehydrogenase